MSTLNGKELSYGVLHAPIFIPEVGQYGPTLTSTTTGTNRAVKMTIDEPFVILEVKNKGGQTITLPVPIHMFTHTVLGKNQE